MTINIMLHCKDGIVLGCDSLGSQVKSFFVPGSGKPLISKKNEPILNPETNKPIIDVNSMKKMPVVINSLGYENKIMSIKDYPIGILISGISSLGQRSIESLIYEFSDLLPKFDDVKKEFKMKSLVEDFKKYISGIYSENFSSLPNTQTGPMLTFLIGGFSSKEIFGKIYKLDFPKNKLEAINKNNSYSMTATGQSDAIERFLNGMEKKTLNDIFFGIESKVSSTLKKMEKHTRDHIFSELESQKIKFDKKKISNTPTLEIKEKIPFKLAKYQVPFNLFSIQNAVDFVIFLIYITYGRQRFVVGVPTVGSKIRVGYITKRDGFRDLTPQKINVSLFEEDIYE